jgi:hypothetical protein
MTNASNGGLRRYTDFLTAGCMKTDADGRKVFYPWGIFGSGYAFPSDAAYERLNDLLKIYMIVMFVLIVPVVSARQYVAAAIVAALTMAFQLIWTRIELRKLQRVEGKLTYGEALTNMARVIPGWFLWTCEIGSLVFVAGGFLMLVTEPSRWMAAVFAILFFGTCAVAYTFMLVKRRRSLNAQS